MTKVTTTRSETIAADICALLRARNSVIWIVTREESRVEGYLFEAAAAAGYVAHTWDVAQGCANMAGTPESIGDKDPDAMLEAIRDRANPRQQTKQRGVWIMRDLPVWLAGPPGARTLRMLRNCARTLPAVDKESAQAIIILSPNGDVPPELAGHAVVLEWPLPDRAEIADTLDNLIKKYELTEMLTNGKRDAAIDAAVGLSGEEAEACYSKSLVATRTIDPAAVSNEKKRVIARERVLEWFDPLPGGLDSVGGLENLKVWLKARSTAYSPQARAYGLPSPRGALLMGISGCGKSLTAKAIATAWQVPLLRLDLGALKSKFVGESEQNLRKALKVIEAIGRCVVWLDEVEKALQGATSGSADGGVSSDALGAILSWMQERSGEAFVIATANDVSQLPPELLRKGRFDEIWWIDLPTPTERKAVLSAALRQHGRGEVKVDLTKVAAECNDFTGSEIAAIVPDALFSAFNDGAREITTADLIEAAGTVVPLAKTAEKKIEAMRTWAVGKARPATKPDAERAAGKQRGRNLDI
jgi:hypothetical protein